MNFLVVIFHGTSNPIINTHSHFLNNVWERGGGHTNNIDQRYMFLLNECRQLG